MERVNTGPGPLDLDMSGRHSDGAVDVQAGVHGTTAPNFETVRDAFSAVVRDTESRTRSPHGHALCVLVEGSVAAHVWAGQRTLGHAWQSSTRQCVFSCSKAVTTICVLQAVDAGLVDLDLPVAHYWPEFAACGKESLSVREAMGHRAGLPAPDRSFTQDEITAWFPIVDHLAQQEPTFTPGEQHSYHAITWGFIVGEVLRRATGATPSQWYDQNIRSALNLEASFGLRPGESASDLAQCAEPPDALVGIPVTPGLDLSRRAALADSAYAPSLFAASHRDDYYAGECPAANFVSSAHDLAQLMAATASPVAGLVEPLVTRARIIDALRPVSRGARYLSVDDGKVWGTGFYASCPSRPMVSPASFGHDGAGGQLAFGDLEHRLGFAYVTTAPGDATDSRANDLAAAVRECLTIAE